MNKNRLEAFSDGVIAIIITIMVLEFKVPHESGLKVLIPLLPTFFCYALSFIFIGIYFYPLGYSLYQDPGLGFQSGIHFGNTFL